MASCCNDSSKCVKNILRDVERLLSKRPKVLTRLIMLASGMEDMGCMSLSYLPGIVRSQGRARGAGAVRLNAL